MAIEFDRRTFLGLAATVVLTGGAGLVEGGSSNIEALRRNGEPLLDGVFPVRLSPPYPGNDADDTPIRKDPFRDLENTLDTGEINKALRGQEIQARLVFGAPYEGPHNQKESDRASLVKSAWGDQLQRAGVTDYWKFKHRGAKHGVWAELSFPAPILIDGREISKAYASLHQVLPVSR